MQAILYCYSNIGKHYIHEYLTTQTSKMLTKSQNKSVTSMCQSGPLETTSQDDDVLQKSKQIDGCLKYFFRIFFYVNNTSFFFIVNYFFISYLHISYKHCFFYLFLLSAIQAAILFTLRNMQSGEHRLSKNKLTKTRLHKRCLA